MPLSLNRKKTHGDSGCRLYAKGGDGIRRKYVLWGKECVRVKHIVFERD
jgi:hypothetical protein